MRRPSARRRRAAALVVLALLVAGGIAALRTRTAWDQACTVARQRLPQALGMEVGIGRCELDPLTASVRLYGISAYPKGGAEHPVFAADEADVTLGSVFPFFGAFELSHVRVARPRVFVDLANAPPKKKGPAEPSGGGCPLEVLERLELGHVEVTGAELRMAMPDGRNLELLGVDAEWRSRGDAAEIRVDASRGVFSSPSSRPLAISRVSVEASLDVDGQALELSRAEADVEDATVSVSGKIERLCDPRLLLDGQVFVPLPTLARAAGLTQRLSGHAWARVVASGSTREPSLAVDLSATGVEIDKYRPGDFTARLSWAGKDIRIGELDLPMGAGSVRASGTLGLSAAVPLSLDFQVENAQMARILEKAGIPGAWVDVLATGRGELKGQLRPGMDLIGKADLQLSRFIVATRPFDAPPARGRTILQFRQGQIDAEFHVLDDRVEVKSADIRSGHSSVLAQATLYYAQERGLRVSGHSELDLGELGPIAQFSSAGTGSADFDVSGTYAGVKVEAPISLRDFHFDDFALGVVSSKLTYEHDVLSFDPVIGQKGLTKYSGQGDVDFRNPQTAFDIDVAVNGRVQDLVDVVVGLSPKVELFQGPITGAVGGGKVHISGPTDSYGGTIELPLSGVQYYGRRLGAGQVSLALEEGNALVLRQLSLEGAAGALEAQGRWSFDGPIDYRFVARDLRLDELIGPERAARLGISGTARVAGRAWGDTDTPLVEASISSPGVALRGSSLGVAQLEVRVKGRELRLWNRLADGAKCDLTMQLRDPIPYEGTLLLDLPDLRALLPEGAVSRGVSGAAQGRLAFAGNARDLDSAQLDADLSRLSVWRGEVRVENEGPIHLLYSGGRLDLGAVTLRGSNTRITAEGWLEPERLDLKLQGAMDLRLLESFVPSLEHTGGTVEVAAAATGPIRRPALVGSAQVRDARLSVRDFPVALRSLSADIQFSEQAVFIEQADGILNDGRVSLRGKVEVGELSVRNVDMGAHLEGVYLRLTDDLPLAVSGDLQISGNGSVLSLGGGVDVSRFLYEKPLVLDELIRDLARPRLVASASTEKPAEWLRFDELAVNLVDVRVDNNLAKAALLGHLKLTGGNVQPGLLGTVETAVGSQAFFRGNRFDLTQGAIDFRNPHSIESVFDMHAETRVREYQVRLHAFGRTSEPKVLLTSDPPLSENDIITLLTVGVTSRDSENAATAATSLAGEALFAATGFDRQVQRFIPKNGILINPEMHMVTGYNELSGQVEPLASLETRLLTQQLKLGMTRPFSGRGTRVNAEYQWDNGLSAQAQWEENSEAHSPFGNFGLDLKYRWESE